MSDNVIIDIYGAFSKITGPYPRHAVREATSYFVQGAQFSTAYKRGKWDGRKNLMKMTTGAFPTGLLDEVVEVVKNHGLEVEINDHREEPAPSEKGFSLKGISFDYPYDYQLKACQKAIEEKQGIIKVSTGGGKTIIAAGIIQYLGLKTLFIVPSQELMYQTQKSFLKTLGKTEKEIGVVGDGKWKPGTWVTVAMMPTLSARSSSQECQDLLSEADVIFADECHQAPAESFFSVLTLCNAYWRIGMSATPLDRSDGADLRLIALMGKIIVDVGTKELTERGVLARADIIFDKVTHPVLKKGSQYSTAYKHGVVENAQLLSKVVEWSQIFYRNNISTLILCEEIKHGTLIDEALWSHENLNEFIPHQFIHGSEDSEIRKSARESFSNRQLPVLVASRIFDQGIDVDTVDALILAGSRKSKIKTMQRLGRGLRGKKLIVVEFSNFCHKYLLAHSYERLQDYKAEDCFPIHYSGPDEELVKKIWNKDE